MKWEVRKSWMRSTYFVIDRFINEADLKRDFADVSRKMRYKWYFKNDIEIPAFYNKSTWNPPQGQLALEMFLNQMEAVVFSRLPGNITRYNLIKKECLALRGCVADCDKTSRQGFLCRCLG